MALGYSWNTIRYGVHRQEWNGHKLIQQDHKACIAGTSLVSVTIPNSVETAHLDADTHKIYSESETIGNTMPNVRQEKKKCIWLSPGK